MNMNARLRSLRPYMTVFRLRALMETQYRAAALGGLVTQVFFGLVYIFLYTALYAGNSPEMLRDTITYVWLQQMFFRMMFSSDGELTNLIMSGGVAYMLVRPVDQHRFWVCRDVGGRLVGAMMRLIPMLAVQFILPRELRIGLPDGWLSLAQFGLSLLIGCVCLCELMSILDAINMKTLDKRGVSAILNLTMMTFSGNVIPLTLFPDGLQTLIRYQPFAQALDAPIRMYQSCAALPEWALTVAVQLVWIVILRWIGRSMWQRRLDNMTVQGG
ncbi:MAG: ABC-2 family transporter protein [Clostridia bacterium]|nr:ABC-2 family transporter protein [Clostridia bacterium]